jgi:hypothetical protein
MPGAAALLEKKKEPVKGQLVDRETFQKATSPEFIRVERGISSSCQSIYPGEVVCRFPVARSDKSGCQARIERNVAAG